MALVNLPGQEEVLANALTATILMLLLIKILLIIKFVKDVTINVIPVLIKILVPGVNLLGLLVHNVNAHLDTI